MRGRSAGIAVHMAARVSQAAGPGEVLVSNTVKDLVAGSGLTFESLGTKHFKGFAEPAAIFAPILPSSGRRPLPATRARRHAVGGLRLYALSARLPFAVIARSVSDEAIQGQMSQSSSVCPWIASLRSQ
jgi:hypothetical protein